MFENVDQSLEAWDRFIAELHRVWNGSGWRSPTAPIAGSGVVVAKDRRFRQQLQLVLTRCGMLVVTEQDCSLVARRNDWSLIVIDQGSLTGEAERWLAATRGNRLPLRVLIADDRSFARRCYDAKLADWTYTSPFPAELLAGRLMQYLSR